MDIQFTPDGKIKQKVLNLTHADLDGASSAMMLHALFTDVTSVPLSYGTSNKLTNYINEIAATPHMINQYDAIFITDLSLHADHVKKLFTAFAVADFKGHFVWLDHHDSSKEFHNPKNNIFIVDDICGAKLTKRYLESIYEVNLSKYDYFIELVDDYDLWKHKDKNSKRLNYIFNHYMKVDKDNGYNNFMNYYLKNNIEFNNLTTLEQSIIYKAEKEISDTWENLDVTVMKDSKIGFMMVDPSLVSEISAMVLENSELDVIINYPPNYGSGSIRAKDTNIKDINVAKVAKYLFEHGNLLSSAGGHPHACGFTVKNLTYKMSSQEKFKLVQPVVSLITDALLSTYPELE